MIARIRGTLVQLEGLVAYVEVGPIWYEVLLPTSVVPRLPPLGEEVVLYLHAYIEGGQMSSGMHQRLIGFLDQVEREFFELMLTVGGLGAKKAARAMAIPLSRMATAIERADERTLKSLPEVGPSTAKKIIAHLQGKAGKFALLRDTTHAATASAAAAPATDESSGAAPGAASAQVTSPAAATTAPQRSGSGEELLEIIEDAHKVLTTLLHYTEREASEMIHEALQTKPRPTSSDELLQTVFQVTGKVRTGGA